MSEPVPGGDYEVTEVQTASGQVVVTHYRCLHAHVVPVEAGGEVVAHLCTDCDAQLVGGVPPMSEQQPDEVDTPLDPFADPAAPSVPPPRDTPRTGPTSETVEQRERRCPFHKTCICSHTECRNGWLDVDEPNPTPLNDANVASRRCPTCHDAQIMHSELAGMKGRR